MGPPIPDQKLSRCVSFKLTFLSVSSSLPSVGRSSVYTMKKSLNG